MDGRDIVPRLPPRRGFVGSVVTGGRRMSRASRRKSLAVGAAVAVAGCFLLLAADASGLPTGLWTTAGVVAAAVALASLPPLLAEVVAPVRDLTPGERSRLNLPPGEPVKVVAADGLANAFAAGVLPGARVVFVTTGLLRNLTTAEVRAIVAHERGHHRRHHVALRLGSVALFVAAWLAATATGVPGGFSAGVLALGPVVLLVCRLGRWTEYDADAYAARRVDGATLASALDRVHADARPSTARGRLAALVSMHPPVDRRLARLSGEQAGAAGATRADGGRASLTARVAGLAGGVLTACARSPSGPRLTDGRFPLEDAIDAMVRASQKVETALTRWRGTVVYETTTAQQSLRVVDRGRVRWLFLDGDAHSAIDLDDPRKHVSAYTRYFHLPFLFREDIENVLFVGGGGFVGPNRFLAEYDVDVDVIEQDPAVVDAAERFFAVEPSDRLSVYVEDGRQFLRETDRTYDLIVLDAFEAGRPPSRLTTVEFMQLARDRLSADGVLFANLVATPSGPLSGFYRAECETMARVFPHVYSFPTTVSVLPQNVEVVATKGDELVGPTALRRRNERGDAGLDLSSELDTYRHVSATDSGRVLRDDDPPADRS